MLDVTVNVFFRQMYVTVEFKVLKFSTPTFLQIFQKNSEELVTLDCNEILSNCLLIFVKVQNSDAFFRVALHCLLKYAITFMFVYICPLIELYNNFV